MNTFYFAAAICCLSLPAFSQDTLRRVVTGEVMVRSTRSNGKDGVAFTTVSKKEIEKNNLGADLPFLLNGTPSLVATSDAGTGTGYTGIRIRGTDATRINVTIDGIPYNDAESQGTYFVDIPDIASSVETVQVQRGVGTSTNGAGAFGGSVNIQTRNLSMTPFVESNNSFGYYNTLKNTLLLGTGLINGRWAAEARWSDINSDGYIERAFSHLKSFFVSGVYIGKSDYMKINVFSGQEKTYQAWDGVPQDSLTHHRRFNVFNYPNQTDNYTQDHAQWLYSHQMRNAWSCHLALHITYGKGYYEEFLAAQPFSAYALPDLTIGGTSIDSTDLTRRQWLDNYFYGTTYSVNSKPNKALSFLVGGAYNQYKGLHFGEIIHATYAQDIPYRYRYYNNTGVKTDFNVFFKPSWNIQKLHMSLDVQARRVNVHLYGKDETQNDIAQRHTLIFLNPKFGFVLDLIHAGHLYASYGLASKEPNRDDYVQAPTGAPPHSEYLRDFELGYQKKWANVETTVNGFLMNYKDQLVLTGKLNDVGNPIRTNVPVSYRYGLESEAKWQPIPVLAWSANLSLSVNRVRNYSAVLYDANNTPYVTHFKNTPIAYSPSAVAYSLIAFSLTRNLKIAFQSKFVGKQYIDNTGDEERKIHPYFLNDFKCTYTAASRAMKEIKFLLSLNNLFNVLYVSNGNAYPSIVNGRPVNANYYFPQAPFTISGGVNVRF